MRLETAVGEWEWSVRGDGEWRKGFWWLVGGRWSLAGEANPLLEGGRKRLAGEANSLLEGGRWRLAGEANVLDASGMVRVAFSSAASANDLICCSRSLCVWSRGG